MNPIVKTATGFEIVIAPGVVVILNGTETIAEVYDLIDTHLQFQLQPMAWNHEKGFHVEVDE